MLAAPVSDPALLPGWAGEPKWDGFRAGVSVDASQVVLRSRRGTDMAPAFPEVVAGAAQLPDATALDGKLVVWDAAGRLTFERLQNRLAARCQGGPGGGEVADPLRRARSAEAVRDRHDRVAVPAAPGRAGVRVHRPPAVGAVGAVPVDHRGRRRCSRA
ncbi:ATP-dependent DNA ligase [Streptomyces mirabilis]|uniref:ATP-dependent DNA ligase n=1 Tax=Streptomyces mirabilis TaxID=68239 RepID=UPI0033E758CE